MNGPSPFAGFDRVNTGDKRGVVVPMANMNVRSIDLSQANLLDDFDVDGNFIYLDRRTTGLLNVQFNSSAMPPFPMGANSGIHGFPYNKLLLSWAAQTGKVAYIWYGYGAQIIPPNQDISNIGSITNPVTVESPYGVEFGSTTFLNAANETVFAAASNTAGARISAMEFTSKDVSGQYVTRRGFIAHTAAPAAWLDGALLLQGKHRLFQAGHSSCDGQLPFPLTVPANLGIFYRNDYAIAEVDGTSRTVLYTL